jgi:type IV secretory pathway VirB2 component (pilin)
MNSLAKNQYCPRFLVRSLVFFLISFLIITNYEVALADFSTKDPIGDQLCKIIKTVQGNTAKVIAVAALLAVGVGLFMGKVNWGVALTTAVGVMILFGAESIVGWLSGSGSGTCNPST